jgi:DNA (cytosine-5)-methyltransferase 1
VPIDPLLPDDPDRAQSARRLRVGSLCTGYGGLDLAVHAVLGGRLVFVADPDRHVRAVLAARFPGVPNLGDITRVDFTTLTTDPTTQLSTELAAAPGDGRLLEVLTAGFPCQDISGIGRRAGIKEGNRSGLWFDVARAVRALRPRLLVVENVAAIRYPGRGLDVVLGELAQAGYDAWWCCLRAADVGAPHYRERLFLLAHPSTDPDGRVGGDGFRRGCVAADADRGRHPARRGPGGTAPPRAATTAVRRGDPDPGHLLPRRPIHAPAAAGILTCPAGDHPMGDDASVDPTGDPVGDLDFRTLAESGRCEWGIYRAAIARWARVLGRPAPAPTYPDPGGTPRLSPRFVEWLMGLPAGWVTDVSGLPWGAQIRALGNGVVPLQAQTALRMLLGDAGLCAATAAGPVAAGCADSAGRWAA